MAINKKYLIAGSAFAICIAISLAMFQGKKPIEKVLEKPVVENVKTEATIPEPVSIKEEEPVVDIPAAESEEEEEDDYGYYFNTTINAALSSKANYDYGNSDMSTLPQCKILHTETIQRHGARHLNKIKKLDAIIERFEDLIEKGTMKTTTVLEWAKELREKEKDNTGSICETGKFELGEIASRLRERVHLDDDKSGDIYVETTFKKRTHQSRDAFLESLLPEDFPAEHVHFLPYDQCEAIRDEDGKVNQKVFENYAPLRFFSICPKYHEYRQEPDLNKIVNESFEYNPEIPLITKNNKIWDAIMKSPAEQPQAVLTQTLHDLYLMCQFEGSCYNDYTRSCDILLREPAILEQLKYDDDMRLYTFKGEGNPLNWRMACPLARSILRGIGANYLAALKDEEKKEAFQATYGEYFDFASEPVSRMHLRFGHAESVLPLFFFFTMKPPRPQRNRMGFSGSDFVPMSANMQFDLVECDNEYYVHFFANEVPTKMDFPVNFDATYFKIEDMFAGYINTLRANEMENCLYADWTGICGEPACKA